MSIEVELDEDDILFRAEVLDFFRACPGVEVRQSLVIDGAQFDEVYLAEEIAGFIGRGFICAVPAGKAISLSFIESLPAFSFVIILRDRWKAPRPWKQRDGIRIQTWNRSIFERRRAEVLAKISPPPIHSPTASVQIDGRGWRLPECRGFVLRLGPGGSLQGNTLYDLLEDLGDHAERVREELEEQVKGGLEPELPMAMELGVPGCVGTLILATPHRRDGRYAGAESHKAIVELAGRLNIRRIALPLIGAAEAGAEAAIDSIAQAIHQARLPHPLHVVVVLPDTHGLDYARAKLAGPAGPVAEEHTRFLNDAVWRMTVTDRLGVAEEARVFARLLASRSTRLPLAVGLFGRWGSGKSFFMKLIEQEMKELARAPGADGPFYTKVAHIHFNAWHYLDSNLWASLALRIFDGVAEELADKPQERDGAALAIARERRSLTERIASNRRLKAEAEEAITAAQDARAQAERAILEAEEQRRQAATEFSLERIKAIAGPDWAKELKAVMAATGIAEPAHLDSLEKALAKASQTATGFQKLLPGTLLRLHAWVRYPLLVALAMAVATVMERWPDIRAQVQAHLHLSLEPITTAVASLAGLASWVSHRLDKARQVPERVARLLERLRAARQVAAASEATPDKASAVARLDQKIESLRRQIDETDREIASAATRLQQVNAGVLVYDFLRERSGDRTYLDGTGVVSTLRNDLEQLEDQLRELNKEKGARVQRIVLYIDDLDRCEPRQVVDVLQAVHLLLAFELFAVVVAVDPRWLERSLYDRYLPDHDELTEDERRASEFSPQNYLEKIFQVPYRIPFMDDQGFGQLITFLAETQGPREEPVGAPAEAARHPADAPTPAAEEPGGDEPAEQPSPVLAEGEGTAPQDEVSPAPLPPAGPLPMLALERHEVQTMGRLQAFIPTPRAAKRLVNVYALIRAQMEVADQPALARLVDPQKKDGPALLLMLAMDIGFARASATLRRALEVSPDDTTAIELVTLCQERCRAVGGSLVDEFRRLKDALVDLQEAGQDLPRAGAMKPWLTHVARFSFQEAEDLPAAWSGAP